MAASAALSQRARPSHRKLLIAFLAAALTFLAGNVDESYLRSQPVYDVYIYQCYARAFWQGPAAALQGNSTLHYCPSFLSANASRYHSLPREYPIGSLAVFSLPLITPWMDYNSGYVFWMLVVLATAVLVVSARASPASAVALGIYVFVAGWQFALERYDLVVGLLIALTLVLAQQRRTRLAVAVLALSTLLKIVPIALLPLIILHARRTDGRWRIDCVVLYLGLVALGVAGSAIISPTDALASVRFLLRRPLQIESSAGIVLWISHWLGNQVQITFYNSYNVDGGFQSILSLFTLALAVAGIAVVAVRQWLLHDTLSYSFTAMLLVIMVTSKVFSPQYCLWLLPSIALAEGFRLQWLLVCVLFLLPAVDGISTFTPLQSSAPGTLKTALVVANPLFVLDTVLRDTVLWFFAVRMLCRRTAGRMRFDEGP